MKKNLAQSSKVQTAFQKIWVLKLNDPLTQKAFWIRLNLLSSRNGFNRIAEVWAAYFERNPSTRDVKKVVLKQSYPLQSCLLEEDVSEVKVGDCELSPRHTRGSIQSKGHNIEWDLTFFAAKKCSFQSIPKFLSQTKLIQNSIMTLDEDLYFSGTITVDREISHLKQAPGIRSLAQGTHSGDSWTLGHCNTFFDPAGKAASFIFEGLSIRAKIGPFISPSIPSLYFSYKNEDYFFNNLKDLFHIRSKSELNQWEFRADRGELSFRGQIKAEHKDFIGLTFEDTNGSLLYSANTKLADMRILIYRAGKLETTLTANGSASLEVVSREQNPYVPLLI